ncbi:hypothetical protein SAMN05444156_2252 [Verrucomicrobium sp. GAS474]|nr:hypothetical protein SAMN05444156_2252 [Verrucomicrobium sp. GAS474]
MQARSINIETIPPFTEALPWADTEEGVKTLYSFALSSTRTVPAGSIVRIFYVKPVPTEAPVRIMGSDEQREQAYTRSSGLPKDAKAIYGSPEVEAALKSAHTIVWPNIASFRASLDLINLIDLRVVYMAPGAKDYSDERLAMPEGLLLAEKEGFVTILAVVKGSSSQLAGLRAGDRIVAFNGKALSGETATLATFFTEYQRSSELKIGEQKPYRFRIQRGDAPAPVEFSLRPPPSLTGSLIDQ